MLLSSFLDADDFVILVGFREDAVDTKKLEVFFAEGLQLLSKVLRTLEILFDDRGR